MACAGLGAILCPGETCCKGYGASDGTHADIWRERASVTMLLLRYDMIIIIISKSLSYHNKRAPV